tara:strand:+ start:38394 stop:38786 length:393 start_codon:yes stop_codon:yes gene_type:complete
MMLKIDESNFVLFAANNYDNPQCMDEIEFFHDLKRFRYLKRLFNKYQETGELKERLILNHLVVLYNMFGSDAATRMLFFRLEEYLPMLKPFLIFLSQLPEVVTGIGIENRTIRTVNIPSDQNIIDELRRI